MNLQEYYIKQYSTDIRNIPNIFHREYTDFRFIDFGWPRHEFGGREWGNYVSDTQHIREKKYFIMVLFATTLFIKNLHYNFIEEFKKIITMDQQIIPGAGKGFGANVMKICFILDVPEQHGVKLTDADITELIEFFEQESQKELQRTDINFNEFVEKIINDSEFKSYNPDTNFGRFVNMFNQKYKK